MRTEDLTNFVAVAGSPSLLAAAQKLGISQPTLSKSIARLERALGISVIERLPRGIALSDAGRAFLEHARPALIGLADGVDVVRQLRTGRAGVVRIGLGVGVPQALVVEALRPLLRDAELSVEISGGMSNSLSRSVAAGECDFAVTSVPPDGAPSIRWDPVFRDPMVPIVSSTHPLAGARRINWETLSRQLWLTPGPGTSVRSWFERQFRERDLPVPSRIISIRDYSATPDFGVPLGAVCLTPASVVRMTPAARRHRTLRVPADWLSDRFVGIVQRRGGYLGPAAQRLVERIREVGRSRFA